MSAAVEELNRVRLRVVWSQEELEEAWLCAWADEALDSPIA